jgi:hypothetical protein
VAVSGLAKFSCEFHAKFVQASAAFTVLTVLQEERNKVFLRCVLCYFQYRTGLNVHFRCESVIAKRLLYTFDEHSLFEKHFKLELYISMRSVFILGARIATGYGLDDREV